jgi:hypothetical protein
MRQCGTGSHAFDCAEDRGQKITTACPAHCGVTGITAGSAENHWRALFYMAPKKL